MHPLRARELVLEDTPPRAPRTLVRRASHIAAVCVLAAVPAARAAAQASQAAPLPPRAVAVIRDSVRAVLKRAYADSAFPGAYAMVGSRNAIYASMGVGHLDWAPSPAPTENTMYDMASLTKVVGTTTAMMQLYESGAIGLDDPVQKYLPNWVGPHKNLVTVRNLLTHSSGLPPYKLFYKALKSPAATMAMVYATPLDTLPGVRMVYSDIGAILMGEIVRRVSGDRLDHYLAEHVFRPLGMASTMFNPPLALLPRIAPTEYEAWRDTLVRGEVHDENAYELGGVAGHAGLFSTAHDLGIFAQMMLNGGTYHGIHVLLPATIATFTTVQDSAFSNRALGWEVPDATNSAGHLMSSHAFGHTGFTGTSIWIDPPRNLFIILLSNRVDPTRDNKKIYGVRVELADAVGAVVNAAEHGRSGTAKRTP